MSSFQFVENSAAIVEEKDFFDKIALVAHNCYQVPAKTHQENIAFIQRIVQGGHLAMVEHYRFLFRVTAQMYALAVAFCNPFVVPLADGKDFYVSLSARPLIENRQDPHMAYFCSVLIQSLPTDVKMNLFTHIERGDEHMALVDPDAIRDLLGERIYNKARYVTYHLITDRGVTHEIVRHRLCSFAQESTRYCNYTKDKFGNTLTFMKPLRYDDFKDVYDSYYQKTADTYFDLIANGEKPDEARAVLPNSLKASIMVTANIEEWKHIFELRISDAAHPDIRRLMNLVRDDMIQKGFLLPEPAAPIAEPAATEEKKA
jgi:thymidylate synthase ThyX